MGDPLSVAGSALWVISLGLQACQGLALYINKYQCAVKEINDFKCKVEGLGLILKGLHDALTDADKTDPPLSGKFKVALRMITDCESGIKELSSTLLKLQNSSLYVSQGVFPALKTTSKQALYPFRRDSLVGHLSVLEGLQDNLDTTLAVLQVYVEPSPFLIFAVLNVS